MASELSAKPGVSTHKCLPRRNSDLYMRLRSVGSADGTRQITSEQYVRVCSCSQLKVTAGIKVLNTEICSAAHRNKYVSCAMCYAVRFESTCTQRARTSLHPSRSSALAPCCSLSHLHQKKTFSGTPCRYAGGGNNVQRCVPPDEQGAAAAFQNVCTATSTPTASRTPAQLQGTTPTRNTGL